MNAGGSNPPLKRDLTALMYGGTTPGLFGADALEGDDDGDDGKPDRADKMFDDSEEDDDGAAFLDNLNKPKEEKQITTTLGGGG